MAKATYSIAKVREAKTEYVPGDVIVISNHVKKDNGSSHAFSVEEAMEKLEDLYELDRHMDAIHFEEALRAFEEEKELETFVIIIEELD